MTDYTKATDFAAKDALITGDPDKVIKGTEFETEFDAIVTAIATKSDSATPTFTGDVTITTGSVILDSGEGIDFSATADGTTMVSEVLDDYEEGTFTPFVTDNDGSDTATHTLEAGFYTKIGDTVFVTFTIAHSNKTGLTGAQQARIGGLPFTAATMSPVTARAGGVAATEASGFFALGTAGNYAAGVIASGDTFIDLYEYDSTDGSSILFVDDLSGTGDDATFIGQYKAA